jgi:hypothetical protein
LILDRERAVAVGIIVWQGWRAAWSPELLSHRSTLPLTAALCARELPRMSDFMFLNVPDLRRLDRRHNADFPTQRHEFHLIGAAIAIHVNDRPHVPGLQAKG